MPLYGAKKETLRDFEDALKHYEKKVKKMGRTHIDMGFKERDDFFWSMKEAGDKLAVTGQGAQVLMDGCVSEGVIRLFGETLDYIRATADKPSRSKEARMKTLLALKNLYVAAKPIITSKHSKED